LKTNVKRLSKEQRIKRDRQFEYLKEVRCKFHKQNAPSISGDTKKKEPIGNFKNPGTR